MNTKRIVNVVVLIVVVGLLWTGWKMTSRNAYESAEYRTIESEGKFELREYPDLMLVTTQMKRGSQGNDGSFGRLFNYISGQNDEKSKVAMTTPVFMEPEAKTPNAANTTPQPNGRMGFVLPASVADGAIPQPTNGRVQIAKRSGGKFAALKFSGRMNTESRQEVEKELREWIESKGWAAMQEVEFAGYDPPWTPGPLRRNEVLVRINENL